MKASTVFSTFLVLVAIASGLAQPVESELFKFRVPSREVYRLEKQPPSGANKTLKPQWIKAWPASGSTNFVELGSRVVVQLRAGTSPDDLISGHLLELSRIVAPGVFIFQAPDAFSAVQEAHRLASLPEVSAAYPVMRKLGELHGPYAAQPSDSLFDWQWNMENRNPDGSRAGVDLNVRAAWPYSQGEGVTIAVADTGIEMQHPELASRVSGAPHRNFAKDSTNVGPYNDYYGAAHGTEVAGLAAASLGNNRMVGVAPGAKLASWVIFHTNATLASDEELMDMFQFQSNVVQVQNHSWGHIGFPPGQVTLLEAIGISNSVASGRDGKGVVIVRSAGNGRTSAINANNDGYTADPRVITVAAVRQDGRVASYSQAGACVLVAAPSGDSAAGFGGLFTTDLLGTRGANVISFFPPYEDLSGYVFEGLGFTGTSAAVPQISGIAALVLSANTNLTYRDVQQILILSARHFDPADPDLGTNGAGFVVSHNDGFGVPNAGLAVELARSWIPRPAESIVTYSSDAPAAIPDAGLRVVVTGVNGAALASIPAVAGSGLHIEEQSHALWLEDVGYGTNVPGFGLTNTGVLIQRDAATFTPKIISAAQAGAEFAIVYNFATNSLGYGPPGGDFPVLMATDFAPIPSVFIGYNDGEALKELFRTNESALAQIRLASTSYMFTVTNTLLCEHVGLRVMTDHQRRGDLRITLVSPSGTRSVLQQYGFDETPGPADWTYYSTHHFGESTAGAWTAYISDERAGATGAVQSVSLILQGIPIADTDADGLSDDWEREYFGGLQMGPQDDPDRDGYSNAREQIMGSNPTKPNHLPFTVDLSAWNASIRRLSWPSSPRDSYEIWGGPNPQFLELITNVPGQFHETEWFTPSNSVPDRFFRVRARPSP